MRRRLAWAILAGSVVVANLILFTAGGAGAASLGDSGWWWRANAGTRLEPPAPVPPVNLPTEAPAPPAPPTVPEGGLYVSRAPDGAAAVSAVRFTLFESESSPVLELKVVAGGQSAMEADILACMTGAAWTGEEAGRWDYKPLLECDVARGGGSVNGIPNEDGTVWTFPLEPLLIDGPGGKEIDVVLAPAFDADAPGGVQAPFEVAFDALNEDSLKTSGGGSSASEGDFADVENLIEQTSDAGGGATLDVPVGSDFSAPPPASPALPPEDQGLSATAPAIRNATTPTMQPVSSTDNDARLPAVAVLLAGLIAAYFVSRQPIPALHPLTRMGQERGVPTIAPTAPATGGLGRFVRPRTGPPPTL